jgi:hypothetical protein
MLIITYATIKKHARLHLIQDFNISLLMTADRISENVAKTIIFNQ